MDLLRFAAIGSVDDEKSTLIGRLLHDTKQLFDDQIEAVQASRRRGVDGMDLSFVTDGLRAEREQTRRHVCIAALLGVRHFIVAANKMDRIDWDRSAYDRVVSERARLCHRLGVSSCVVVPVSALHGDNVAGRTEATPWYRGPTVLEALEQAPAGEWAGVHRTRAGSGARLPVQWVLRRPGGGRMYAGMINGGSLRTGDEVVVLLGGQRSTVTMLETMDGPRDEAQVGLSVPVELADDVDVSRGDLLAVADDVPDVVCEMVATICWFAGQPLSAGGRYRIKHTTRTTPARIVSVGGRLDLKRLELQPADALSENDIGVVTVAVAAPLVTDPYHRNRITGSFVLIDPASTATVAAGMVGPPDLHPRKDPDVSLSASDRSDMLDTAG